MSVPSNPPAPFDLEFLRKDAKRLTRACRARDLAALARLRGALSRLAQLDDESLAARICLADAQQTIAREHGFADWAALTRASQPIDALLDAVRAGDLPAIATSLGRFSAQSRNSVFAACALGDVPALQHHLDADATLAVAMHRDWPLMAYCCASPVHRLTGRHSAGLLGCATVLLDRGVDPSATTPGEEGPVPITFRAQQSGNWAVAMLLQRRGADASALRPHFMRVMQTKHAWADTIAEFYARPDVRRQLAAALATWQAQNPGHAGHFTPLDLRVFHDLPGRAMTPSLSEVPIWALPSIDWQGPNGVLVGVTHAFPVALVDLLLSRGFDCRTPRLHGRGLVATAIRAGRRDIARLLRAHGSPDDDVTPRDELIGACLCLDAVGARAIVAAHPAVATSLEREDYDLQASAARSSADHLRLMVDVGIPAGDRGSSGATALHVAAWHGRPDTVDMLLAHGASTGVRDVTYDETPGDWARHGAIHCRTADAEYRAVAERLRRRP